MSDKVVKIKSTLTHRANQKVTLPEGLGEVSFNEACIGEVSPEVAERLASMNLAGFEIVKDEKVTTSPPSADEIEFTEESLSKLKMKELQELAKESELPEEEWKAFTKKADLITYILGKVNDPEEKEEQSEEEEEENTNTEQE